MSFDGFVTARLPSLLRYAVVLTGDQHLAQDVVQEVLARAQLRWDRIERAGSPEAYLRRRTSTPRCRRRPAGTGC